MKIRETSCALALLLASSFPQLTLADDVQNFLKIDCEPSIGYFSVKPVGTFYFDATPPNGFIPLANGQSFNKNRSERIKKEGSDNFGTCSIPNIWIAKKIKVLDFSVRRTASYPPAHCGGCGTWRGRFEISVNDKIISKSIVGRADMYSIENVEYSEGELKICRSLTRSGYRERDELGEYPISCKIIPISDFLAPNEKAPK